jgi:chromosome partitioning protein
MRKLCISLSKGGTGKTTTAINLAAGLALSGSRVLLIDLDTQGHVSRALGATAEAGLADILQETIKAEEALVQTREGLWILAGGRALAGVKRLLSMKQFGGELAVSEALGPLEGRFDYVLLDTAPGWDVLSVNALFYAEEILSPVSLEALTLQGLVDFSQSLQAVQKYNQKLALRYILPTFLDGRVRKSQEILEQLQRAYGSKVCQAIRYNVRLSEAPAYGQTIYEYAPNSPGAEDYRTLTERIKADG